MVGNGSVDRAQPYLMEAQKLTKSFADKGSRITILKNFDVCLNAGEAVAVVGPSGVGKSTLLHILGTLDRPDSGTLRISNKDVFKLESNPLAAFRNRSIGFVFQFHHLLPEFTAVENTMMPGLIAKKSKQACTLAAEEILVRVGLKDRLHHRVNTLSGGEQQRVALARALVLAPKVLLADEPTGNLDKNNSEAVHQLLMELNSEMEMTMVVVTHNTELAALMNRRISINEGRLMEIG